MAFIKNLICIIPRLDSERIQFTIHTSLGVLSRTYLVEKLKCLKTRKNFILNNIWTSGEHAKYFVEAISEETHVRTLLGRRFLGFIKQIEKSKSITGRNIRKIQKWIRIASAKFKNMILSLEATVKWK